MLFTSAKISHLALLPQGEKEQTKRVSAMVATMDEEGFGSCTNTGACSAECPKEIGQTNIARLNREFVKAQVSNLLDKKYTKHAHHKKQREKGFSTKHLLCWAQLQ